MCARREPRIPFGSVLVTGQLSLLMTTSSPGIWVTTVAQLRYGCPRPRRMVGPTLDNIHATVGSRIWNPHVPSFLIPILHQYFSEKPTLQNRDTHCCQYSFSIVRVHAPLSKPLRTISHEIKVGHRSVGEARRQTQKFACPNGT